MSHTNRASQLMESLNGTPSFGTQAPRTPRQPVEERKAKLTADHWLLLDKKGFNYSKDDVVLKVARPSRSTPSDATWPEGANAAIRVGAFQKELQRAGQDHEILQQLAEATVEGPMIVSRTMANKMLETGKWSHNATEILSRADYRGKQLAGFSVSGQYFTAEDVSHVVTEAGNVEGIVTHDGQLYAGTRVMTAEAFDSRVQDERAAHSPIVLKTVTIAQMREWEASREWQRERGTVLTRVVMNGRTMVSYRVNRVLLNAQRGMSSDSYVTHVVLDNKRIVGVATNLGQLYVTDGLKPVPVMKANHEEHGVDANLTELAGWLESVAGDIPKALAELKRGNVGSAAKGVVAKLERTQQEDWYTALFR